MSEPSGINALEAKVDELRSENADLREQLSDAVELLAEAFWQWASIENGYGCMWTNGATGRAVFAFFGIADGSHRDGVLGAIAARKRPKGDRCSECGQIDHGQYGEYPCKLCGLPTVWEGSRPEGSE